MMEIVNGIRWSNDDAEVIGRALRGQESTLGDNEAGKQVVGRHLHRIVKSNAGAIPVATEEVYFGPDLYDLLKVIDALTDHALPQTTVSWWREQGAPGGDDAVAGLAREKSELCNRLIEARSIVLGALAMVMKPEERRQLEADRRLESIEEATIAPAVGQKWRLPPGGKPVVIVKVEGAFVIVKGADESKTNLRHARGGHLLSVTELAEGTMLDEGPVF